MAEFDLAVTGPLNRSKLLQHAHGGADPAMIEAFLHYLRDEKVTSISPVAARQAVATGCMATESLRRNNSQRIIPPVSRENLDYFHNTSNFEDTHQ